MKLPLGVGGVTVIDGDRPDITNLHRQLFFEAADVAERHPKAQTAVEWMTDFVLKVALWRSYKTDLGQKPDRFANLKLAPHGN